MKINFILFFHALMLLSLMVTAQPANDDCTSANILVELSSCSPTSGTTVNATQSIPPIICAGLTGNSDDDVWYSFTATTSYVTIRVTSSSSFDAVVDFRSDQCDGNTIACADAKGLGGTEIINKGGLLIGSSYLIRIYSYGYGTTTQGTFTVCVYGSPPYPPGNDQCWGAIELLEGYGCDPTTATTVSATQSAPPILCNEITGSSDDDVWFFFRATTTNPTITVTGQPNFDAVVDLRSGYCNGTTIECADSTAKGGIETIYTNGLTLNSNYLIRVYSYGDGPNDEGEFDVCVSERVCQPCPAYDTSIYPNGTWQTYYSSVVSLGCTVFRVNVAAGNEYTFKTGCGDSGDADFNTYLELFNSNCTLLASDDNMCEDKHSKITWIAGSDGFVNLKLRGASNSDFGNFTLAYRISAPVSVIKPDALTSPDGLTDIYPNPASEKLSVKTTHPVSFSEVLVIDITGRIVNRYVTENFTTFSTFNLPDPEPGLYIIAINTSHGWVHKRLEIIR